MDVDVLQVYQNSGSTDWLASSRGPGWIEEYRNCVRSLRKKDVRPCIVLQWIHKTLEKHVFWTKSMRPENDGNMVINSLVFSWNGCKFICFVVFLAPRMWVKSANRSNAKAVKSYEFIGEISIFRLHRAGFEREWGGKTAETLCTLCYLE